LFIVPPFLLMNYRNILSRFNKGGTIPLYAMREQVLVPKYTFNQQFI